MTHIEAIYQGGVFKPLEGVDLNENQRVRLGIQLIAETDVRAWLKEVQDHHKQLVDKQGYLPNSAEEIAADRTRSDPAAAPFSEG